jgi:hypothetical protein
MPFPPPVTTTIFSSIKPIFLTSGDPELSLSSPHDNCQQRLAQGSLGMKILGCREP